MFTTQHALQGSYLNANPILLAYRLLSLHEFLLLSTNLPDTLGRSHWWGKVHGFVLNLRCTSTK